MRILWLITAVATVLCAAADGGATKSNEPMRFRPITQGEYETILSITEGKPVISEGRLIVSGLAALTAGLKTVLATSMLPSFLASLNPGSNQKVKGAYPLCVIRTQDVVDEDNSHEKSSNQGGENNYEHDHYNYDHNHHNQGGHYPNHGHGNPNHGHEHSHEHDHDDESAEIVYNKKRPPVVNCIVVVKDDDDDDHKSTTTTTTTTTTRRPITTKRPHHPHPPHRPPPHHFAPPPQHWGRYEAAPLYNPWYWFNPYYQYAYAGYAGTPPGMWQDGINRQGDTPAQQNFNSPSQMVTQPDQSNTDDAADSEVINATRVRNSRPALTRSKHPKQSSSMRTKHSKRKRDEIGSNSYAKISNYIESGYQPSYYPQVNYHSHYPKVAYTQALPYPAPVYVSSSTRRPMTMAAYIKRQKEAIVDSEELENSAEYIKVRSNQ